jgi:hypothetical protein
MTDSCGCGGRLCVFQLQLGRKLDAAPITRDYLFTPPASTIPQPAEAAG